MSDDQQTPSEPAQETEYISFDEFLERVPPGQSREVSVLIKITDRVDGQPSRFSFSLPEIQLPCETCNGERFFRPKDDDYIGNLRPPTQLEFVEYLCANCQRYTKIYSLRLAIEIRGTKQLALICYKLGEFPPYGPPTPSRLISLLGPGRDLFLKGRRCENLGLGIGAFIYYRRVVEDQKNRILDEIIKVAEAVGTPPKTIDALRKARKEHQFSKAMDEVKDAIPQRLLIDGQNPLTLLHSALSKLVHNHTDEFCLELATDIRLILAELAELLGHALKDERELKDAVARLRRLPS